VAAAEDILRKNIRAKDQDRLVQEFMTKVVEAK
jgi:F0F1-type ATP synthase membrane subunit b/b'